MNLCVIGGGPVGLEMAVSAVKRGLTVTLLEKGDRIGWNVRRWGHVQLFSNNSLNVSKDGRNVLQDRVIDDRAYPTGSQYLSEYLEPLAAFLQQSGKCDIHTGVEVLSVGKADVSKGLLGPARQKKTFRILVSAKQSNGQFSEGEHYLEGFDNVVDASGTYGNPNWMGKGGTPALGERALRERRKSRMLQGTDDSPKVTAVIGSGASAVTTLKALQSLSEKGGGVGVVWVTRHGQNPYHLIDNDSLPQRHALYSLGNKLSCHYTNFNTFSYMGNCQVVAIRKEPNGKTEVELEECKTGLKTKVSVDNVVANVGYRPDMRLSEELQVHYCYATEGPIKLAAALMSSGGGGGDCLAQVSHGSDSLKNPEPGFYIIGMKSYGRGSAFLLKIGHEQVQAVLDLIISECEN